MGKYADYLRRIEKRDIATYIYHWNHPGEKLCNARDRAAGYNSRQSVWLAIRRIKKGLQENP